MSAFAIVREASKTYMPPPAPTALLPETVKSVRLTLSYRFQIAPPEPEAVLLVIVVSVIVSVMQD